MSLKEQEAHKRLYEKLKNQRNAGENNLVIQNEKIVSYIPHSHRSRVITNPSTTSNTHEPINKSASATKPNELLLKLPWNLMNLTHLVIMKQVLIPDTTHPIKKESITSYKESTFVNAPNLHKSINNLLQNLAIVNFSSVTNK